MKLTPDQIHALAELAHLVWSNREARMAFRAVCEFERAVIDVARLSRRIDYEALRRKAEEVKR